MSVIIVAVAAADSAYNATIRNSGGWCDLRTHHSGPSPALRVSRPMSQSFLMTDDSPLMSQEFYIWHPTSSSESSTISSSRIVWVLVWVSLWWLFWSQIIIWIAAIISATKHQMISLWVKTTWCRTVTHSVQQLAITFVMHPARTRMTCLWSILSLAAAAIYSSSMQEYQLFGWETSWVTICENWYHQARDS